MRIKKINHTDESIRRRLFDFLAPYETHALFILGNLAANFPGSHLYVARDGDDWLGVAGYYEGPKTLIPFSTDPDITRKLVRHVAKRHPTVEYMNSIGYAGKPAYETLLKMKYEPDNDPLQVFMELDHEPDPQPHEDRVMLKRPSDHEQIARLMRCFRKDTRPEDPVTEEELRKVRMNDLSYALHVDHRIVSIASTNGIGINAFQLLAVVTHPEHRRHGYARAVCAFLTREMFRKGAARCALFTNPTNEAAVGCYEGLGFRITGDFYVARFKVKSDV
jgi:ribosomal protein S18 acetylase RimI-like enzyme